MNIRTVGIIFVFSILLLLTFQAVWLYNTYHLEKERIQVNINGYLQECVKEEMLARFEVESSDDKSIDVSTGKEYPYPDDPEVKVAEFNLESSTDNGLLQFFLFLSGNNMKLAVVDSLFQQKTLDAHYQLDYLICYKDSTGVLLEEVGESMLNEQKGLFTSDSIPIVNKSYVHLLANISMPVVLKQMIGLTILSFLMLLILMIALVVQIRYAYNQYRLNRLREDFSHALIHDLKSPLNTIYIALSGFKNGVFAKNPVFGEKATDIALDQVLNIQTLVDRILTIARLETKSLEADCTETDLPVMVDGLVERYRLSAGKDASFETYYNLHDAPVYMDGALVERAISNLIDNAIKYSGDSVRIRITCETKEDKLFIRVKDNGFGISDKDQQKIFNKFERGAAVFRRGGAKGFGLGLSYARLVTIAHQGTIALSSIKGEGSEFVLVLGLLVVPFDDNDKSNE